MVFLVAGGQVVFLVAGGLVVFLVACGYPGVAGGQWLSILQVVLKFSLLQVV